MPRLENPEKFERASTDEILECARKVVTAETGRCLVFDINSVTAVPKFRSSELSLGQVVGRGGFNTVTEVLAIKLKNKVKTGTSGSAAGSVAGSTAGSIKSRNTHSVPGSIGGEGDSHSIAGSSSCATSTKAQREEVRDRTATALKERKKKYVIKKLESSLLKHDRVNYLKGLMDLVLEGQFLASLHHENIIQLCGISKKCPFEELGYFLMLDQLNTTLAKQLQDWAVKEKKNNAGGFMKNKNKLNVKKQELWVSRLHVAFDIASALNYLHNRHIIYRDVVSVYDAPLCMY